MDPCLRRDPTNARGNSRFLRRQEPISPALERLQDGSLPAQGSDKRAGQFEVPAKAGTHFASEGAVAGWIPACVGIRQTRGAIRGSLRRQEPFSPAKERLQDGSLPSQGPDKRAGQFGVPAKAGTHFASEGAVAGWIPAFAGIR